MSERHTNGPGEGEQKLPPVVIRNTRQADIPDLDALQRASYPTLSELLKWKPKHWESHIATFPDGQWVAEVDGMVVGLCANLRVPFEQATSQHTWKEITDNGLIAGTHDPRGDTLYGFEIMVHPDHRRRGIGKMLYEARFDYIRREELHCFCAMGRFPGYVKKGKPRDLSPDDYVKKVVAGEISDRTLTAQIKSGCKVHGVVHDYLRDPKSANAAAILIWENPEWEGPEVPTILERASEALAPDLAAASTGE